MTKWVTRNTLREALARRIESMRPSVDGVHEAMLEVTHFGVTYAAVASALQSTELRMQRWSAGADIPGTVAERRAILSTLQRLLSELPSAPDRRRKPVAATTVQERYRRIDERIAASADVLCLQCQRRQATGDEVCGRRACRLQRQGLPRTTEVTE